VQDLLATWSATRIKTPTIGIRPSRFPRTATAPSSILAMTEARRLRSAPSRGRSHWKLAAQGLDQGVLDPFQILLFAKKASS